MRGDCLKTIIELHLLKQDVERTLGVFDGDFTIDGDDILEDFARVLKGTIGVTGRIDFSTEFYDSGFSSIIKYIAEVDGEWTKEEIQDDISKNIGLPIQDLVLKYL